VSSRLRAALSRERGTPRLVWVPGHAAHVTLRFIGEVPDTTLTAIEAALGPGIAHPPFPVTWQTVGMFPPGRRPRVVWMGATAGHAGLVTLAARLDTQLESVIARREGRRLTPHVTVARVKDAGQGIDWPRVVADATPRATVTDVDHVTLYQSHLSEKGSTYTVRLRVPLY
jgi:RNA 2',3'-cyclic 3'-phosphodiesterase